MVAGAKTLLGHPVKSTRNMDNSSRLCNPSQGRKNGRQNEYFKRKKLDFLRSTNLKFVNEIKGNGCDSLRFIISVRGGNLNLQLQTCKCKT